MSVNLAHVNSVRPLKGERGYFLFNVELAWEVPDRSPIAVTVDAATLLDHRKMQETVLHHHGFLLAVGGKDCEERQHTWLNFVAEAMANP